MTLGTAGLLGGVPQALRDPLLIHYKRLARNFLEKRWEPAELNAGKLCEVVYSILEGALTGQYAQRPAKPRDMVQACRRLEQTPADANRVGDRSLRVLIPRVLLALYEVRNNRGVGHVAGDVDSNKMDATMVFGAANWMVCELVRVFHQATLDEAQSAVSALVERRLPEIWEIGERRRVLNNSLRAREQVLLLLYSEAGWVALEELRDWIEYKNSTSFRQKVVLPLHKSRHLEFEADTGRLQLSPKGAVEVEDKILPIL